MKRKFRRGCRGAISVFLVIIFVAQYALCGLLVDGARQKMSQAMAESALDSASYSVLSYYNKLLFDLYGLMGTDSLSKDDISTLMNDYVGKTLGAVDVDPSAFSSILSLFGADASGGGFDGYDFQFGPSNADTPQITVELTTNLADTDFVQYQLIEHMKYRAPVSLLTSDTGLLAKLGQLNEAKAQIQAVTDRLEITKSNQAVMDTAKEASQLIDPPTGGGSSSLRTAVQNYVGSHTPAELFQLYEDAVTAVEAVIEANDEAMNPPPPPPPPESAAAAGVTLPEPEPPTPWTKAKWKSALTDELEEVLNAYKAIREDAAALSVKAANAESMLDEAVFGSSSQPGYQGYIAQLEAAKGSADSSAASVFDTEIQSAKASAGALLRSKPFVEMVKLASARIAQADENFLKDAINDLAQKLYDSDGGDYSTSRLEKERLYWEGLYNSATGDYTLPTDLTAAASHPSYLIAEGESGLKAALSATTAGEVAGDAEGKDGVKLSKAKDEVEEEPVETAGLANLKDKEDDMEGAYSDPPAADDTSATLEMGDIDDGAGAEVLSGVTDIFDKLLQLLEDQRDSLYIAQYIVTYFPNYVNNYKATDSAPAATAKFNSAPYKNYCATQAEVEYILTGKTDTGASITTVKAMLLGVRTAFNLAAIFTDPSKVSQANAIAAAISGPFAPAVAIAILVGWAVAESAMDVSRLCSGEEIAVFKGHGDWNLSIEGLVDYVADTVTDAISNTVSTLSQKAKNAANEAIYDAQTTAEGGVDKAKTALTQWADGILSSVDVTDNAGASSVIAEIKSDINTGLSSGFDDLVGNKAKKLFQDLGSKATLQITNTVDKVSNKVETSLKGYISNATKAASEKVSEALKGSDAEASGGFSFPTIKMGYMDYIQIFLLMTGADTRTQRIQQLIQVNMRAGGESGFKMAESFGALKAELTGSIKFLFMSEAIIPAELRQSGRLDFTVHSSVSY